MVLDDRFHKTDHNSTFVESDQARISQGHLTTSVPANIRFEPRKRPTSLDRQRACAAESRPVQINSPARNNRKQRRRDYRSTVGSPGWRSVRYSAEAASVDRRLNDHAKATAPVRGDKLRPWDFGVSRLRCPRRPEGTGWSCRSKFKSQRAAPRRSALPGMPTSTFGARPGDASARQLAKATAAKVHL
jgi:hypothetical protein